MAVGVHMASKRTWFRGPLTLRALSFPQRTKTSLMRPVQVARDQISELALPFSISFDAVSGTRMLWRTSAILFSIIALLVETLLGQSVVVTRNVNLRTGPSTSHSIIELLHPTDELMLLEPASPSGYYHVRTAGGEAGWVWGRNVRIESFVEEESDDGPPEFYNGCGPEGTAQNDRFRALNRLKNRNRAPSPGDMDSTVTLAALLEPGDDRDRWLESRGGEILGFIFDVKPGGKETVNCGAAELSFRDTHIELTLTGEDTLKTQRVVVEVTPRWRAFMSEHGIDWSTDQLKEDLEGHCARFRGWLFWDDPHWKEAENTSPEGAHNWRATAWEIHPVTEIETAACPDLD